jgi:hypothetical protein
MPNLSSIPLYLVATGLRTIPQWFPQVGSCGIRESGGDLRVKTHVYGVEWRENDESGVRFYFRGAQGTPRDTLEFRRAPKSRFLAVCSCFHSIISRKFRIWAQISFLRNSGNSARHSRIQKGTQKSIFGIVHMLPL